MKLMTMVFWIAISALLSTNIVPAKDYSVTAGNWKVDFKSNEILYTNAKLNSLADGSEYYEVSINKDPGITSRASSLFFWNYFNSPAPSNRAWMVKYITSLFNATNKTPTISDYSIDGQKALIAEGWSADFEKFVYGAMYPIDPTSDNTASQMVGFLSNLDKKTSFEIIDSLHVEYDENVPQSSTSAWSTQSSSLALNEPASALGTRENPIPMGTSVNLGDGWVITVLSVTTDAIGQILQENQFNDRPTAGNQFFMARVRASYDGAGSDTFGGSYRLRAVGPSGIGYSTFENSAGVIPNPLPGSEVFSGGSIEGNIAWQIKSSDAGSLVMYDSSSNKEGRLYMALYGGQTLQSSSLSSDKVWEDKGTGKMGRY